MISPMMKETEPHAEKFRRFETETKQPAWLVPLREAGMARFCELGFPTPRDEDWRFTNLAPVAKLPFRPVLKASVHGLTSETIGRFTFGGLAAIRLVFVNGHFAPELSAESLKPAGVQIGSLAAALADGSTVLQEYLARRSAEDVDSFTALNTAFFQDGAFIHVPAGIVVEVPIHLLFISTGSETGATSHPRTVILVDARGQATVLENYVSLDSAPSFINAFTELELGESAGLEHCKFQDESPSAFHVAAIHSRLGRGANLLAHSIATGARLSRNNIRTCLAGEGAECVLNGLYVTHGDQLADHHMVVDHAQPHCNSHEYYNGILDDRSKGVFHGRIHVHAGAQKTDAKQTNKNLLLSEHATVDTKPQLEIYADDVKCTHGATIGQLNEESIFYLRARGIGLERARRMLIHAFAGEIIDRIRFAPAREELNHIVWQRLEANPQISEIS